MPKPLSRLATSPLAQRLTRALREAGATDLGAYDDDYAILRHHPGVHQRSGGAIVWTLYYIGDGPMNVKATRYQSIYPASKCAQGCVLLHKAYRGQLDQDVAPK